MRDYNFFEAYQKKRDLSINVKSPVFLGLVVILLILATSGGLLVQNMILTSQLSNVQEELIQLQESKDYQEAVKMQERITAFNEFDQNAGSALTRIQDGKNLNTVFLTNLTALLPATTKIKNMNITRSTVSLEIVVPGFKAAGEVMANFENSGYFLQTTLIGVSKDNDTGNFIESINCILKEGDQE